MENSETFSDEMIQMYSGLLMQSNSMALNKMLATISAMQTKVPINPDIFVEEAAQNILNLTPPTSITGTSTPSAAQTVSADDTIPVDEIECDIGVLVAKNFMHYLMLAKGNLDDGDPNGFRLLMTKLCQCPLYHIPPKTIKVPQLLGQGGQQKQFGTKRKLKEPLLTQTALFTNVGEDKSCNEEEEEEGQGSRKRTKTESSDFLQNFDETDFKKLNCSLAISDVTVKSFDDTSGETSKNPEILNIAAELNETTEKLNKLKEDFNATAEQIVIKSPGNAAHSYVARRSTKHAPFSSAEVEMRFNRLKEIQRRKPKIDVDLSKVPYNPNMKRNYPVALRSAQAQVRRDRNTIAARVSRSRSKYYEEFLDNKNSEMLYETLNWKRKIACYRTYASKLIEMLEQEQVDIGEMWDAFVKDKLGKEPKTKTKKDVKQNTEDGEKKLKGEEVNV